jgi:SNF2 family DNA or RNA helicase
MKNKAIIFTQFKEMAKILYRELKEYEPLLFTGDTPQKERHEIVENFNNNKINRILIMTESGTYGLNLQRANYVIHYDLPWSIAKIEQREGRCHRIGQKKNVTIFQLIVQNTIDEYVLKVLYKKQKMSEEMLDKEQSKKVKISKHDIKKLLDFK